MESWKSSGSGRRSCAHSWWDFSHIEGGTRKRRIFLELQEIVISILPGMQNFWIMTPAGENFCSRLDIRGRRHPQRRDTLRMWNCAGKHCCLWEFILKSVRIRRKSLIRMRALIWLSTVTATLMHRTYRLLKSGGVFITEQVGGDNDRDLVEQVLPGDAETVSAFEPERAE